MLFSLWWIFQQNHDPPFMGPLSDETQKINSAISPSETTLLSVHPTAVWYYKMFSIILHSASSTGIPFFADKAYYPKLNCIIHSFNVVSTVRSINNTVQPAQVSYVFYLGVRPVTVHLCKSRLNRIYFWVYFLNQRNNAIRHAWSVD